MVYIAEVSPSVSDDEVLAEANRNAAVLVTGDKDFGELVFRQRRAVAGVVLIRLAGLSAAEKVATVSRVFRDHASDVAGAFAVVSPGRLRIRRRPDAPGVAT